MKTGAGRPGNNEGDHGMNQKSSAVVEAAVAAPRARGPSLIAKIAARFGVEPEKLMATLKATAFRTDKAVTDEQMLALLVVADQYGLNPFTKEIYAFPDKGGIVPVVGVDGWSRIVNEHPQFDGMAFSMPDDGSSCTCEIFRKDRSHSISVTEYMSECKRNVAPWQSHPRRMLRHKALIQCARMAFGFAGVFDQDEAERIVEGEVVETDRPRKGDKVTLATLANKPKKPPAEIVERVVQGELVDADTGEIAPPHRSYAQFADLVLNAADAETAGLILDASRDELTEELQAELVSVWRGKFGKT